MNISRADVGINGDTDQFTLNEQIERARQAASRIDSGYYVTDDELDDEELAHAPRRPLDDGGNEWL